MQQPIAQPEQALRATAGITQAGLEREYFAQHLEHQLTAQPGVYLSSEDVARAVVYACTQPETVQVEEVVVRPTTGLSGQRVFHDR